MRTPALIVFGLLLSTAPVLAQPVPVVPPGDKEPILRLEAGGPTSFVTSLAFSPDGRTLYAAGLDKVVRVWKLDAATGQYVLDQGAYRIPIGPGSFGMINALAVSPDGAWLAVGGIGVIREGSGFRRPGLILPSAARMTDEMREDEGTIYLFNTRNRAVKPLRGHRGSVITLAFAPVQAGKPQLLASAARDWDSTGKQFVGGVRLWDVEAGTAVSRLAENLPDPRSTRPELAVRHTGADLKQAQVAIAWMDGRFRAWDVTRGDLLTATDGNNNRTVAALPDSARFLTGSTAKLQPWSSGADRKLQPDADVLKVGAAGEVSTWIPAALTLASSGGDGKLDLAAIVLMRGAADRCRLQLVDLVGGTRRAEVAVWQGNRTIPVVAAAPSGKHLAIAGSPEHEIQVFPVADLLKGQAKPQVLRGSGATFRQVGFLTKQDAVGLSLREQPGQDPLVFDFKQRRLTTERAGWADSVVKLGDWSVKLDAGKDERTGAAKPIFLVTRVGQAVKTVELKPTQTVTTFALLPPGRLPRPILAVAGSELGVPMLMLYAADTGEQIRQLSGHTGAIRSLAFSADGRLLASGAEDQTVCVWSMTTIDRVLGKLGQLRGVGVRQPQGGALTVSGIDAATIAAANRDQLKEGDVVEALVLGQQVFPLKTIIEYFDRLFQIEPGKTVVLRVRDAQGQAREAKVVIDQGIDDWKPLLSLFVTRTQPRDWLGWNPLGFYDASNPRAERNLGLHFNTGRPEEPTRFAFTDQYRNDHFREGILDYLVRAGSLSPALEQWKKDRNQKPLPRPGLTLWLDELGLDPKSTDGRGRILVQRRDLTLKLGIDNFPVDRIERVEWQFDNQPPQRFGDPLDGEWSAKLAALAWTRGEHRLRVTLRTEEATTQTWTAELNLRYQPPPPVVTTLLQRRTMVDKPEFTLAALVQPGMPAQEAAIEVIQQAGGAEKARKTLELKGPEFRLEQPLTLSPGDNLVEIVARNTEALPGFEGAETERMSFVVTYTPPKAVAPPRIVLQRLQADDGAALDLLPGQTLTVTSPLVRIRGTIEATEGVTQAVLARGEGAPQPLTGFLAAEAPRQVRVEERLALKPGANRFRFAAKSKESPEVEVPLTITYQPAVPTISLTSPTNGTRRLHGQEPATILVAGPLQMPPDPQAFEAVVLVNDKPQPATIVDGAVRTEVPLDFGVNRLRVRCRNAWGAESTSEDVTVQYLRPPQVGAVSGPSTTEKPFAEVEFGVRSALPLKGAAVSLEVNGRPTVARIELQAVAGKPEQWSGRILEIPLAEGENTIRVTARNDEGEDVKGGRLSVAYRPKQAPVAPVVQLVEPAGDIKATEANTTVHFRVRSATPLKRLDLVREGQTPFRKSYNLADVKPDAEGVYDIKDKLELSPRENLVRVEAVNDGGERTAGFVANYLHVPVRLVLEQLETMDKEGQTLPARVLPDGQLAFDTLPTGRAWLHGRIIWDRESDEQLEKVSSLHVVVNDILQLPTELRPVTGSREKRFRAPIFLNRAQDNQVVVRMPGLKAEASNPARLTLACRAPEEGQRLHLLLVGVGIKDEKQLTTRVLSALQAEKTGERQFKSPAFLRGQLYGPLTGFVSSRQVYHQLHTIRNTIRTLKQADVRSGSPSLTDLIVVYYQGSDVEAGGTYTLLTSEGLDDTARGSSAVVFDDVVRQLSDTPGAPMLLLDTRSASTAPKGVGARTDPTSMLPEEVRLGVLHSSWESTAAVPEETRLLSALEQTIGKVSKLKEMSQEIAVRFGAVSTRYPQSFTYARRIGSGLGELVVGPPRSSDGR